MRGDTDEKLHDENHEDGGGRHQLTGIVVVPYMQKTESRSTKVHDLQQRFPEHIVRKPTR